MTRTVSGSPHDARKTCEPAHAFSVLWDTRNRTIKCPQRFIIRQSDLQMDYMIALHLLKSSKISRDFQGMGRSCQALTNKSVWKRSVSEVSPANMEMILWSQFCLPRDTVLFAPDDQGFQDILTFYHPKNIQTENPQEPQFPPHISIHGILILSPFLQNTHV